MEEWSKPYRDLINAASCLIFIYFLVFRRYSGRYAVKAQKIFTVIQMATALLAWYLVLMYTPLHAR